MIREELMKVFKTVRNSANSFVGISGQYLGYSIMEGLEVGREKCSHVVTKVITGIMTLFRIAVDHFEDKLANERFLDVVQGRKGLVVAALVA